MFNRGQRILLVEDNRMLCLELRTKLEAEGYKVDMAKDAKSALVAFFDEDPNIVILEIALPQFDGFRLIQTLRRQDQATPVLILTEQGAEAERDLGLSMGADSYLTKPFDALDLSVQVEALLTRVSRGVALESVHLQRFGNIEVDFGSRTVRRGMRDVHLKPKQFSVLRALLRARGRAVSRSELRRLVWGDASIGVRIVDTNIARLRKALEEDPSKPQHILTVRSAGYCVKP
jgi:DNA-binding response OmpR family regulator